MTRADAVRNRERVLVAAREVFAEEGVDTGIDVVAARAGVGKATVYRSFPTKEHLVSAITSEIVDAWVARLRATDADAFTVLRRTLREAAEAKAARLVGGLAGQTLDTPAWQATRAVWQEGLADVLARGAADGSIRPDATADEITVQFGGACRVLAAREETDPAVWRRHADLAVAGLRR